MALCGFLFAVCSRCANKFLETLPRKVRRCETTVLTAIAERGIAFSRLFCNTENLLFATEVIAVVRMMGANDPKPDEKLVP